MQQQPAHRLRIKQIRVVDKADRHFPVCLLSDIDVEVEVRHRELAAERRHRARTQTQPGSRALLVVEVNLKQRVVPQVARRGQLAHNALERHRRVFLRCQRRLAHPRHQRVKARRLGQIQPHHDRVDEHPHQALDFRARTLGNRRTDGNVVLAAVTVQQLAERRQQHHVQGRARVPSHRHQLLAQRRGHGDRLHRALEALHQRPGTVRGQLQRGHRGQRVPPVTELLFQKRVAQPAALPQGIVCILHRQLGQR